MGGIPWCARGRAIAVGIVATGALLLGAGQAAAATLSLDGGTLVYQASAGEANAVHVSLQSSPGGPSGIELTDSGSGASPTGGVAIVNNAPTHCAGGGSQVLCQADGITAIRVELGDQNDSIDFTSIALPVAVYGGDGNDTISGTDKPSVLDGGDGNDTLDGGAGDDSLDGGTGGDDLHGGAGIDTVSNADRTNPVTVDMNGNADDGENNENDNVEDDVEVVVGGSGDDRLAGRDCGTDTTGQSSGTSTTTTTTSGGGSAAMQAPAPSCDDTLDGGPGNDTLLGRGGDDKLYGGPGDDQLDGGAGADLLSGGDGQDSVTYGGAKSGVTVTLDGKADDGAAGEGDNVLPDVEDIYGGPGDDTLVGDDQRNLISGEGGNDTIKGEGGDDVLDGGEGADQISGGDGKDIVNYSWEDKPISASYDGKANDGADGEHDNLANDIEGVVGSPAGDTLLGGPGADFLYAYGGDDQIFGGPGTDLIVAGDGNDYIDAMDGTADFVSCGDGTDTALVDPIDNVSSDCETKVVGTAVQITTPGATVPVSAGAATVPVTCQPLLLDPCSGTVQLTAKLPPPAAKPHTSKSKGKAKARAAAHKKKHRPGKKHKRKAAPKHEAKARTVDLGSATYTAAPGATTQVSIALTPVGTAALAKLGRLSVKATATSTDRAGGVSTATQTFVLTAPKAARRPAAHKHEKKT